MSSGRLRLVGGRLRRRLGRRMGMAVLALGSLWLVGTAAAIVWSGWPVVAVVLGVQLAAVGLVLAAVRSSHRQLSAQLRATLASELASLSGEVRKSVGGLRTKLDQHEVRVIRYQDATRARLERRLDTDGQVEGAPIPRQRRAVESPLRPTDKRGGT